MDKLKQYLQNYGRFLSLEDSLPQWEQERAELKVRIGELSLNREQKKWELEHLENPGFFRRLLGKSEEKKEKLTKQLREVTAALNAAKWELEALEKRIDEGKQELEALSGSRERYLQAKQDAQLSTMQESQLVMEEIAAFTPAAIAAADRVLAALEEARPWMQKDVRYTGVSSVNRKMECLALAAENAHRLVALLGILPEGCANIGNYLKAPDGYVDAVTMEYAKLDRLNNAINQVRETRNQLGMLQ
ncbi:MAG: hypothetical protein IJN67_14095 [Oscillospiraceae bacterium]|nr:hypothetical protein [Oscillospiraceae bacterium]